MGAVTKICIATFALQICGRKTVCQQDDIFIIGRGAFKHIVCHCKAALYIGVFKTFVRFIGQVGFNALIFIIDIVACNGTENVIFVAAQTFKF